MGVTLMIIIVLVSNGLEGRKVGRDNKNHQYISHVSTHRHTQTHTHRGLKLHLITELA